MLQIFYNYLTIFIIPIVIGFLVRFLCRRVEKGFFITLGFVVLAVVLWVVALFFSNNGSELYGLTALSTTAMAVTSAVTGLIIQIVKKKRKSAE